MHKVNMVIIEDEFVISEDIKTQVTKQGYEVLSVFDNAETALPFILKNAPDIMLVDIRLNGLMDGIELVEQVQPSHQVPVIYITASSDPSTFNKAIKTMPNAFLVKPFTPANLLAAIGLAFHNFSTGQSPQKIQNPVIPTETGQAVVNQCLFIRSNGRHKKIYSENILFVEAAGSYAHLQTTTDRHTLSHNLTHLLRKTPLPDFVRIHRSYIVNITKVESFDDSWVFIKDHKLPLSSNYRADFLSHIHCL